MDGFAIPGRRGGRLFIISEHGRLPLAALRCRICDTLMLHHGGIILALLDGHAFTRLFRTTDHTAARSDQNLGRGRIESLADLGGCVAKTAQPVTLAE